MAGVDLNRTEFPRQFEEVVKEICAVKIDKLEFMKKGTLSDGESLIVDRREWK
jgi:hypothetical protein